MTRIFLSPRIVLFLAFIALCTHSVRSEAQRAPLPLGTVSGVRQLSACPSGYYPGMTCFQAEMSCPNTVDIGFTFGVASPTNRQQGTVVFLDGGGGTIPSGELDYGKAYLDDDFQIVSMNWASDWENTMSTGGTSIKDAACRPATFLSYINQTLHGTGGMCAQGDSAGSGAVAYALAWYGAGNFLDNVELLSGPVFGDIEQGCVVPNAPTVEVCPFGQLGCDGSPWPDPPSYVLGAQEAVGTWSGDSTCNAGTVTSAASNANWKAMSIVDGTSNPTFVYPQTAMAGWLCSNDDSTQNNSAAEGEFFYREITSSQQTAAYSVTRIDQCSGAEGVTEGTTPDGTSGFTAISRDMIAACVKRH
jgi:hypothetical protein